MCYDGGAVKEGKCPNCGAPVDHDRDKCSYCESKYIFHKNNIQQSQQTNRSSSRPNLLEDNEGCLRAMLSIGLVLIFNSRHRRH